MMISLRTSIPSEQRASSQKKTSPTECCTEYARSAFRNSIFKLSFCIAMMLWTICSFADSESLSGDNAVGLLLVEIQPGTFRMGARPKDREFAHKERWIEDELPIHTVRISRRFWMGKYEVTQAQYTKLMGRNPSRFKASQKPVESVSWRDAMEFCRELTKHERAEGHLPEGYVYRLPTEAEWEYSCRAGGKNVFSFGDSENELHKYAYYANASESHKYGTSIVGTRTPNPWGLHDMHGNVWEWCYDWYDHDYYSHSPKVDPVNLEPASFWVFRGGGWYMMPLGLRCAERCWYNAAYVDGSIGFRVCLAPEIGKLQK